MTTEPVAPYRCPVCTRDTFPRAAEVWTEDRDYCTDCDRVIHIHWTDGDWAYFRVAEAKAILNEPHTSEDCYCPNCSEIKAVSIYCCDRCGYRGVPATFACACYEVPCQGGARRGTGCFHGSLACPVCNDNEGDGDGDPWAILKAVRAALA